MSRNSSPSERYWGLDALRGALVVGMVIFHLLFDLHQYVGMRLGVLLTVWEPIRILGVSAFLLVVGISLTLSHQKRGASYPAHALQRGIFMLALGVIVTFITYFVVPREYVVFGILSLIGSGILLSFMAVHRPVLALIGGIILIAEGMLLSISPTLPSALGWIGPSPFLLDGIDYYPIMPWMGIIFVGIYLGHRIYNEKDPCEQKPVPSVLRPLIWCGQWALLIYLLHQPILLLAIRGFQLA